jgi:hypothetical protein
VASRIWVLTCRRSESVAALSRADDADEAGAIGVLDPHATRLNTSRLAVSRRVVFRERDAVGSMGGWGVR